MRKSITKENPVEGIDLENMKSESEGEHPYEEDLSAMPEEDRERMLYAGVDPDSEERAGTYIMRDQSVVHCNVRQPGIELSAMGTALGKYDWLEEYWWKLVSPSADAYTATVKRHDTMGYFIRAEAGAKSLFPVQSCLFLEHPNIAQSVHNVIIAEEGSELDIITGCTSRKSSGEEAAHLGVSEIYVKKNAKVTFSMIHNWREDIQVRPRTGVIVEEGGTFLSNYICMRPVRDVQMNPLTRLVGRGAVARFSSILVCTPGSRMDIGSRVMLEEKETRTEILSRAITTGGDMIVRGSITGLAPDCKGHLECQGLVLGGGGKIHAIPELDGRVEGIELSHEAAVGKIGQEEVEYLMARGLSEEEATAVIVRGFLNVDIEGLPGVLKEQMDNTVEQLREEAF